MANAKPTLPLGAALRSGPFVLMMVAGGLASVALVMGLAVPSALVPLRVVSMVGALVLAGAAVRWQFRTWGEEFDQRQLSALLVAVSGVLTLICWGSMYRTDWDSMQLALKGLFLVCCIGTVLILLPRLGRKILVSVFVVYHFGGILTATTAVQPHNNAPIPWVPSWMWTNVYRHYLSFAYLNNAYHFYSPEPGPPNLLWFRVEFEPDPDGKTYVYWKRLVNRSDYPTRLQYQRLLALTESTNHPQTASWPLMAQLNEARKVAYAAKKMEFRSNGQLDREYQEPSEQAKKYIRSYVRHVARTTKHPDDLDRKIANIKLYRITHTLINAYQIAGGMSPVDPTLYWTYFLGEFNDNGELKSPTGWGEKPKMGWWDFTPDGAPIWMERDAQDPFLYWLLPIYREGINQPWWEMKVVNHFEKHAEGEDRGKFFKVKYSWDPVEDRLRSVP